MSSPTTIIIGIGSNIARETNIPEGVKQLQQHPKINVQRGSHIYESPAVGGRMNTPDFHNVAVLATTGLEPEELRNELRTIEARQGRKRSTDRNMPRTLDLDIIYYGSLIYEFDEWRIPDPDAMIAPHIAIPVAEIAPTFKHPENNFTAEFLAKKLINPAIIF